MSHVERQQVGVSTLYQTYMCAADDDNDIIDEALYYFKANVFFKSYEVKVLNTLEAAFKVCDTCSEGVSIEKVLEKDTLL